MQAIKQIMQEMGILGRTPQELPQAFAKVFEVIDEQEAQSVREARRRLMKRNILREKELADIERRH